MSKDKASRSNRVPRPGRQRGTGSTRSDPPQSSAEEVEAKLSHTLAERLKELQCLYGISQLVERCGDRMDRLLQGIAELIPPSWQYPDVTCARITFRDEQYVTRNSKKTRWKQSAVIKVGGKEVGLVEVYYLKKMPASDEGPFLKEERALIDAVAERIGRVGESVHATEELRIVHQDLAERVKELQCLYGISQLVERCGNSMERLLQGIAELIPASWRYPEVTCARITFRDSRYVTRRFRETRWRQSADIKVGGTKAGLVEVYYLKKMPASDKGPFLKEEEALIDAIAERIGRTAERALAEEKLRQAYQVLQVESSTLQEANVALRVVLARIEDEKQDIKDTVLANVEKILMPIIHTLEIEVLPAQRAYVQLLRQNLEEIASPFVGALSTAYLSLTPAEIQICNMIRRGMTTKEIAALRHVSAATVRGQREHIRRKLGIANRDINLVTYLHAFKPGLSKKATNDQTTRP